MILEQHTDSIEGQSTNPTIGSLSSKRTALHHPFQDTLKIIRLVFQKPNHFPKQYKKIKLTSHDYPDLYRNVLLKH